MLEKLVVAPDSGQQTDAAPDGVASPGRRKMFTLGAALCGAAAGSAVLGNGATPAHADIVDFLDKIWDLDLIVLNFAHEMEELESEFFTRAVYSTGYRDLQGHEPGVLNLIAQQDREHFEMLEDVRNRLGAKAGGHFETMNAAATRQPRIFHFPRFNSREEFFKAAIELKEDVLFAYHGAAPYLHDKKLLAVAASIAGVEGRHAAVLRELAGAPPVPSPFEGARKPQQSGKKLGRYGFKGGGIR